MKKLIALSLVLASVLFPFNNASAATTLGLITPNGGEKYSVGQVIPIKWTSSFTANGYVSGSLYKLRSNTWDPTNYDQHVETSYPVYFDQEYRGGNKLDWTIPFDVIPGNYAMELSISSTEKFSSQYATMYSERPFTISASRNNGSAPKISTISPNPVAVGSDVTITGSDFGNTNRVTLSQIGIDYPGNMEVLIKKQSRKSITFTVDYYITPGSYDVKVQTSSGISEPVTLEVKAASVTLSPFISSVTPKSVSAGDEITLTGGNFTSKNDINYYTNEVIPYPMPITEDAETEMGSDDSDSSDSKIMPPYPAPDYGYLPGVKSTDGKTLKFKLSDEATPGTYSVSVSNENGYSETAYFTVINPDPLAAHPSGTHVLGTDGAIYHISYGNRSPYPSAAAFLSYKFNNWASVVPATVGDMSLPVAKYIPLGSSQEINYILPFRNGSLVNDKGTVYIISGDQRVPFGSAKAFLDAGFSFSNVVTGDTSYMVTLTPVNTGSESHPNGSLVNDNGTYYLISNGYRIGFPSMTVLESWGYSATEAVKANAVDLKLPISHVTGARPPGQLNLY